MRMRFSIDYFTIWGQRMCLFGNVPELGSGESAKAISMSLVDNEKGRWEVDIELPVNELVQVEYKYMLLDEYNDVTFFEHGDMRRLEIGKLEKDEMLVLDKWRSSNDPENIMFTSAFLNALSKPKSYTEQKSFSRVLKDEKVVRLQIPVTRIENGHRVGVYGSCKSLGNWDNTKALLMENSKNPFWTVEFKVKKDEFPIQYKYFIFDENENRIFFDEDGVNRSLLFDNVGDFKKVICSDQGFRYPRYPWKGSGVAVPVFSLRTKRSFGVGEFLDIKPLVDWAKRTGLKLIQILPINDTVATHTWVDSCPYSGISVFALHPMYLNLEAIGNISSKVTKEIIECQKDMLNNLDQIDYEKVMKLKYQFVKLIYKELKSDFLKSKSFKEFFGKNEEWLKDYAAFSYLREFFGTADFKTWGRFANCSRAVVDEIVSPDSNHFDDVAIHYFIQYHLHLQMLEAANYARDNGVLLKGDIPIGIYRNSVDAWSVPELFNMDSQAGAPPDDFSQDGQNWKFPTYNWERMSQDGFKWWISRLKKMSEYFDAYRIDHILGFFRIWEIPKHSVQGIMGWFNPAIAIDVNEFYERSIPFDYQRFCRPYIRGYMIDNIFGNDANFVKEELLDESSLGCFLPKERFDTQKKVEDFLILGPEASCEQRAFNDKIKAGMFKLLAEVLFFEVPDSNATKFHPRHSMFKTQSFMDLDDHTKGKLWDLYIDYFYRRNEEFWRQQACIKLPAIKNATNMLVCGEDLGMVPDCVPSLMCELGILSLEVQRMPKDPKIEFAHPADYPYLSVATPSSHDTSTIRGWWEEDTSRSQRFYNNILGRMGASPFFCDTSIVKDILIQHFYSPSMWAIFPIQDFLGISDSLKLEDSRHERINLPSISVYYWRYRMHLDIEDLLKQDDFNDQVLDLVKSSGRYWAY